MPGPLSNAHTVTKLPAQDLDRACAFYRDKLGLEQVDGQLELPTWCGADMEDATEANLRSVSR
jgi:catechol 2,3-dioxygenase-like lactoylglutathione lyase family enzyme